MDVQQIADQLEITALLTTYAHAVDAKDWATYRSVFTDDAHVDYSSAGAITGGRDEVADWLANGFGAIPMSMHYIANIEILENTADTATVRAMFYNPMQLPGMAELSYCGGYYHHDLMRTPEGWRSRSLREESLWFVNAPRSSPGEREHRHLRRPMIFARTPRHPLRQVRGPGGLRHNPKFLTHSR